MNLTETIQEYVWHAITGLLWKVLGLVNWWLVAAVVIGAIIILAVLGKLMNKLAKLALVAGALLLLVTLAPNRDATPVVEPSPARPNGGLVGAITGELITGAGKVIGDVAEAAAKATGEALGQAGKAAEQLYENLPSREQVADGLQRAGEQLARAATQAIERMRLPDLPRLDELPIIGPIVKFFNPDPEELRRRQERMALAKAAQEARMRRQAKEMQRRRKRAIARMQGEAMSRQFWMEMDRLQQQARQEELMRQERMRRAVNGMSRNPHLNW
jgi:hypothetical protein